MVGKITARLNSMHLSTAILWLAVLTFNNWLLAIIFNRPLLMHDGSVSEFSVLTQPHAWLFRVLDSLSGILFLVVALVIARSIKWRSASGWLLISGVVLLGAGNFFDALMPLQCSETLSNTCSVPVSLSLHHFVLPTHAYSSIAIGISYFLLPLGGYIYARQNKLKAFSYVSGLLLLVAMVSFASVIGQYVAKNTFSIRTFGMTQETQMLLIGLWFLAWWQVRVGKLLPLKKRLAPVGEKN